MSGWARTACAIRGDGSGAFVDIEDTTEIVDVIDQTAETDARFLERLAAREGFALWIDDTSLHFHRRKQDAAPVHVFTWYSDERGEVISINVESDLVKRAGSVAVKGRDPKGKTTIDTSSTADTAKRWTLGDVIEVVDPKTGTTTLLKRNATASIAPTSSSTATAAGGIEVVDEGSARAGISSFGAAVEIGSTTLECNSIHLDGEQYRGNDFSFDDLGGNACGCAGAPVVCQVLSSGLAPPEPISPGP